MFLSSLVSTNQVLQAHDGKDHPQISLGVLSVHFLAGEEIDWRTNISYVGRLGPLLSDSNQRDGPVVKSTNCSS